jgi:transposase InsO family protein
VLGELTVVEQRFNAVTEVLRDGLKVVEVAERYGVSRQAVHGWLRRYAVGGLDALADRSHRPHGCSHQMPADLEARLCELRRHHPGWGQRRLAHEPVRSGTDPPPGPTSAYRALVRNGLVEPKARRRKADYRRWERSRPIKLWQVDVMGGVFLTDGREGKAVTGIDDHSRFCVAAGLVERANARAVCRVFTQALDRYGVPDELLTDNGKVFTGRLGPHPGEVLFDRTCRGYGITHLLTGVRAPTTTTGKAVDAWVDDDNARRPHQGIAMLVPAQRFRPATRPAPEPAPALPAQPALPMPASSPTKVTRRVTKSGLVCVCYQQVSAGRHPRRPARPHRAAPQHQGGGPAPSSPAHRPTQRPTS